MKRIRPQDARRALRSMWTDIRVWACSDGCIKIGAKWKGPAGLFTRMHAADLVAAVLNIRGKK